MFGKKKIKRELVYLNMKVECLQNEVRRANNKFNLILDHLNLEYVPETEKKEPAKLVEQKSISGIDYTMVCLNKANPPKKKRGRPKKK